MRGPQRFTDLQRYLLGITPKRLSSHLRGLEAAGIIERESEVGRREVWYHLTHKGEELLPVIKALTVWGIDFIMREPIPGEVIYPEHTMSLLSIYLNERRSKLAHPVTWKITMERWSTFILQYDGENWSVQNESAKETDVQVETTSEAWAGFLATRRGNWRQYTALMKFSGETGKVDELFTIICS